MIELIPAPVTALDPTGVSTVANESYLKLFGLDAVSLNRRPLDGAMHPDDIDEAFRAMTAPEDETPYGPVELRVRHADGHYIQCTWMVGCDQESGWRIAAAMDISAHYELQQRLRIEARTDRLTGVANRSGLLEALAEHDLHGPDRILAIVDLDRFKAINDTFGHSTGDAVLRVVAERLQSCVVPTALVSRIGGDEFVVALTVDDGLSVNDIGRRLTNAVSEPIVLGDRRVSISGSVGIATAPSTMEPTELLQHADFAAYEAKQHHGASWVLADQPLVAQRRHEMQLEQELRAAIGTGQFQPWFQPVVRLCDEETVAYESLMRWVLPSGDMVPAFKFIDLASDVGLIAAIGEEVVGQTLDAMALLPPETKVAVNLSPAELGDRHWLDRVLAAIDMHNISRERLTFEVTETSLIADLKTARRRLRRLSDAGFTISLDDFGSGYSSLTYLTTLPIDQVKLDRGLLAGYRATEETRRTFEAVVDFVSSLGYTMVVEGVETRDDHDYLLGLGVTHAQGWYYGKAQPIDSIASHPMVAPDIALRR